MDATYGPVAGWEHDIVWTLPRFCHLLPTDFHAAVLRALGVQNAGFVNFVLLRESGGILGTSDQGELEEADIWARRSSVMRKVRVGVGEGPLGIMSCYLKGLVHGIIYYLNGLVMDKVRFLLLGVLISLILLKDSL